MAKVVQFYIAGKSGKKHIFKLNTFTGIYTMDSAVITAAEYNKALEYFQSHR